MLYVHIGHCSLGRSPSPLQFPPSPFSPQNGVLNSPQTSVEGGRSILLPTWPTIHKPASNQSRLRGVNSVIRSRPAATVRSDLRPAVAPPPTSSPTRKPSQPRPTNNPHNRPPPTIRRESPTQLRPLTRRPPPPQRPRATPLPPKPIPEQPTRRAQPGGNRKWPDEHCPAPTTPSQRRVHRNDGRVRGQRSARNREPAPSRSCPPHTERHPTERPFPLHPVPNFLPLPVPVPVPDRFRPVAYWVPACRCR